MTPSPTKVAEHPRLERLAPLLVLALWACATLPNLTLRSFIYEEGTNAEIARDMLLRWDFLGPVIFGLRWSEHPSLLPLLIAGVAFVTGEVNEWTARLPCIISIALTALLVQALARRYMSLNASILASLMFLFCPMLLQKLTIAEPDTLLTSLSFTAFVVWWNGVERNQLTFVRWIGCGCILGVATLAKGPQPIGFFALGIGGYLVLERRWRDIAGYVLCMLVPSAAILGWAAAVFQPSDQSIWLTYMRLRSSIELADYLYSNLRNLAGTVIELLPAPMLLPFVAWPWPRATAKGPPIIRPLILYSGLCTIVLLFWPGANSRYAMPIAPTLAILAGFGWDALAATRYHMLRRLIGGVVALLIVFQLALMSVVMPIRAADFGRSRLDGQAIEQAIRMNPAPAYCTDMASNQLFYMRAPIRCVEPADIRSLTAPFWLVVPGDSLAVLAELRPELNAHLTVMTTSGPKLVAVRLDAR